MLLNFSYGNALHYIGLYKMLKRSNSTNRVNKDYLREQRHIAKLGGIYDDVYMIKDEILLHHWIIDDSADSYHEVFLLNVKDETEVLRFIEKHNLSKVFNRPPHPFGCSGVKFGGEPSIAKLTECRYVLRYQWQYDV